MLWAPNVQGEIDIRTHTPPPSLPALHIAWLEAAAWAEVFWERVAGDPRLSEDFMPPVADQTPCGPGR